MFKVTLKGFNDFKAVIAGQSEKIKSIVDQELQAAAKDWVTLAKKDAPADVGFLRGAIGYKSLSSLRYEITAQTKYAAYMEFGTKGKYQPIPGTEHIAAQFKGKGGGSFKDLLRNIVRWVARKGITGTYSVKTRKRLGSKVNKYAEDYGAAWPIAISIIKNGVKPHPFFFKQQSLVWPSMLQKITRRINNAKLTTSGRGQIEPV